MNDAFFLTRCKHKVKNEILQITGKYPNYQAVFSFPPIKEKATIFIRSYKDQEKYINDADTYQDLITVNKGVNVSVLPQAAIQKTIGIENFRFLNDTTIEFYLDPGDIQPKNYIDLDPDNAPQNIYLVDYISNPEYCPACRGKGVSCDLQVNHSGKITLITGEEKLKQRVLKALLTPIGMQLYDSSFGSELNLLVGQPIVTDFFRLTINKTVSDCISNLISNQPSTLPAEETIVCLSDLSIEYEEPSNINLKVTVTNANGKDIVVYRTLYLDETADVVGN